MNNKMKNIKLENGIKELKGMVMTHEEKKRIFQNVMDSSSVKIQKPIRSPWMLFLFTNSIFEKRLAYFVIPLIIILTSAGVVFASEGSLPDGLLYPIKVKIVEPIKGAILSSPEAKARYESNLATKRLTEAENLSDKGKLNLSNERKINQLLDNHTEALNKALNDLKKEESREQLDEIMTNFYAQMNAHSRVIEILEEKNDKIDDKINGNQLSNKARMNAENIKSNYKNKEENKESESGDNKNEEKKLEKYNAKRQIVEDLINKTSLNVNKIDKKEFKSEQNIFEDTNETLKKAKDYLEQADIKDKKGDQDEAYNNLIDSEGSIKEAEIFLKTRLKYQESQNEKNH